MSRLIESNSFETRISNMLEDNFQDTGWNSHVFYELDDLIEKGYIGDMDKDSSNPVPDLPEDMSEANKVFILNPSEVKNRSIGKVRADMYVEKLSHIPPGGYIYPLDSNLTGYSTDSWNRTLGYKNQSGKPYVDYLSCKKNISNNAISSNSYNYYDTIFSCPQPYDKIVGTKPCYTYEGVHSFSSPSSNVLKYGKLGDNLQYSWQSCLYEYTGYSFKKLKSNPVNSPDGFQIRGYSSKTASPYFKASFIAKKNSKYVASFYVKTSGDNCKITLPYICPGGSLEFNSSTYVVTKDWTRVYFSSLNELTAGNVYDVTFKWTEGYNSDSCDLKVCAIVCEEGEVPSMYSSAGQSYVTDAVVDSYHQVAALKLVNSSNTYVPNVFIFDKMQKTKKACYDMLGNIKYGYTSKGLLKVGNNLTGVDFSNHIGSWEHIYIKIYNNKFTYISMSNSGDMKKATVDISDFDFNILISKMWISNKYIGMNLLDTVGVNYNDEPLSYNDQDIIYAEATEYEKYLMDIICNMTLGAYEDSGNIVTHDTVYRNLITFVENTDNNLILKNYFEKLSSPCMAVKHADKDYDNDIIKIQSPLFVERDLEG